MMQRIASYPTAWEAELARGLLVDHGIDAVLQDDVIVNTNWLYSNAVGGVKLFVPDESVDEASKLLAVKVDVVETACPECESTDFEYYRNNWLFALFMVMIMVPFGYDRRLYMCNNCGNKW